MPATDRQNQLSLKSAYLVSLGWRRPKLQTSEKGLFSSDQRGPISSGSLTSRNDLHIKCSVTPHDKICTARFGPVASQPRGLSQVHPEPIPPTLIPPRHLSRGVTEVLLDKTLVDLSARSKAGPEGVAGEQRKTLLFWEVAPNASVQHGMLDQPR